ncbi:ThiF family adenylyltransferase [Lysinibacillus sp. NPDC047702]|uniref:ThiF family adenylyltransferase n=1 Tax=unclassified Lysinibacillus TaxID=2636778 RepID=UPI003D07F4EF
MTTHYNVQKHNTIYQVKDRILIGTMPPKAQVIEEAPDYLGNILKYFSKPRTLDDSFKFITSNSSLSEIEARNLVEELIENKIISNKKFDSDNRYSRHSLYFDLIDAPINAQEILANKTVGLVGMGGIGTNIAMNLAGAGIGKLIFSDGDTIELSNLTRQFLYHEEHVNNFKVEQAAKQLALINSEIELVPILESISDVEIFDKYFNECDIIILSADSPAEIHEWINSAAMKHGFAYSNAGYIDSFGAIGPMVIPGKTACYECYKNDGDLYKFLDNGQELPSNLNESFQAPSYGPLNSMVAAIQANEVIRYLIGVERKTEGTRLLINSQNYKIYEEVFTKNENCKKCGHFTHHTENLHASFQESSLTDVYVNERENDSFNSILLDSMMDRLIKVLPNTKILDIGCATGEQAIHFAQKGATIVANDISEEMLEVVNNKVNILELKGIETLHGDIVNLNIEDKFNYVICNNVLDYIEDIGTRLSKFAGLLTENGTLIVTIPHPIKDGGVWKKEYYNGRWNYEDFSLQNYFAEGKITKSRENKDGETVISSIESYHRTTETYFQTFVQAGFKVVGLFEPQPPNIVAETHPILFEKCSHIPYFQTFVLKKE